MSLEHPAVTRQRLRPAAVFRQHDLDGQEVELKTNTQLTRENPRLTTELHRPVIDAD